MKLKQLPEDFKVEEINDFSISKDRGSHKLYLLEKKSIETFSLLSYLSRENHIPLNEFGIAGLKDRHAVTKQYFTIPAKYSIKTPEEQNLKITFLGYINKGLKLGDLKGNRFEITARALKKGELDGIQQKAGTLESIGVPNYFDSQRFGSVIGKEFIAKRLIKKDYENAVKIYLTQFSKSESGRAKQDKRLIGQNWGNFSNITIRTPALAAVADEYKRSKSWLSAYKKISPGLREMFVSAYQSYLWNECIKKLLIANVNKRTLYSIKYNIGSLLYYKKLSEQEMKSIPENFRTISDDIKPTGLEKGIISKVLEKEGLTLEDFRIKAETGSFFKSHERKTILKPSQLRISQPSFDELNDKGRKNTFKITLSFVLPKGSYATVVTKRLFNQ